MTSIQHLLDRNTSTQQYQTCDQYLPAMGIIREPRRKLRDLSHSLRSVCPDRQCGFGL